jgi:peroxiredoxin
MLLAAGLAVIAGLTAGKTAAVARAGLSVGAPAPDFTLDAALAGKSFRFSLAEALKKGPVVLYFYPKSFTSVCTEEAHLFAEAAPKLAAMGASVLGVSSDDIETQKKFSSSECRDAFPVAADPDLKAILAYDAKMPVVGYAARISYVVGRDGRIASIVKDSSAAPHVDAALAQVRKLAGG